MNDGRIILKPITSVANQSKEELWIVPYVKKKLAIIKYLPKSTQLLCIINSLNTPSNRNFTGPVIGPGTNLISADINPLISNNIEEIIFKFISCNNILQSTIINLIKWI